MSMEPLPRSEADARYELARLAEILPRVGHHLQTLGVPDGAAAHIGAEAQMLGRTVMVARDAALREIAGRAA